MSVTAIIHTKNSAKTVAHALKSVSFADEVLVVDMESDDDTLDIAAKHKATILHHRDVGFVEPARNFAISKATQNWILILDSDEQIPGSLRKKILEITASPESADIYHVPRKNIVFNYWMQHTGWWPDYQVRLFKKGTVRWGKAVHSQPTLSGKAEYVPAEEDLAIIHNNYPTIESFIERLNRYTSIAAGELLQAKRKPAFTASHFFQTFNDEFLKRFFALEGYKDGPHGLSLALLQAMYQLISQLKYWQALGFPQSRQDTQKLVKHIQAWQKQLNYWVADWHIQNSSGLVRLWWQIRRKAMF